MSHPFKLPGIAMYDCIQETIDKIVLMREKQDHDILESIESVLRNSIDECIEIASDITTAEVWLNDITDILLGEKDIKRNRNTEDYKLGTTSFEVEQKLSAYIHKLCEDKYTNENKNQLKKQSEFLHIVIDHIRKTYYNWKEHLFTCYDYKFLKNTNLELEKSHSSMKRKHRKITGLKNTHNFLLAHGEHFAFIFNLELSTELMMIILQSVNHEKLKSKIKDELNKSKKRGKDRLTIKNISQRLKEIGNEWGN